MFVLYICICSWRIYTVIKTKAGMTVEELGEQYCLIGPYNEACVRTEVEIMEPYNEAMPAAIAQMRDHGIKVRTEITHTQPMDW